MGASGNILIVDDDPAILEALTAALSPPHYVVTAQNGTQALERVEGQILRLVLLDYLLPDASGLNLLRAIHRISASLPIILMTGFGSEDVAVESFRGGVRDYLKKPFSVPDLVTRVERLLGESVGDGSSRPGAEPQADQGCPPGEHRLPSRSLQRAIV